MTSTDCRHCQTYALLDGPEAQCPKCRAANPNERTVRRNETHAAIWRLVREDGLTVAEAEAHVGAVARVMN